MPDIKLRCRTCNLDFWFTERDQEFYKEMGEKDGGQPWAPPKHCKSCRTKRKIEKEQRQKHFAPQNLEEEGQYLNE